ncbi:MAG: hypothetical protein IIZ68_08185 [Clostridia bacterium]|nr:hypothetical protein [Clostridia bacterium]
MDAQKISEAVKACDLLAARTQDMGIITLAKRLHGMTERQHKPTMALVSFNMNHAERFELLRSYAGVEIPAALGTKAAGEPLCLVLDYSPQPTLLADGGTDGVTVYGCPCEALRSHRIAICDEIREKDKWIALADEIDITCLLVNATMAMNQVERTWLQNCGQPLFWDNTPVIAMVGTQLLNSEEDAQAVAEAVNGALKRLQLSTKVFEQPQEALAWMDAFLNGEGVGESHDRRVARNCLLSSRDRAKAFLDETVVDGSAIDAAIKQLEQQRKSLEMAAQLTSESILHNEMGRLKVMAVESIRDYGRQLATRIKSQVESCPLDQLGTVDEIVNQQNMQAWDSFIGNMKATTESQMQEITQRLSAQLEVDAGELLSRLDESARRAAYSAIAMGLHGEQDGVTIPAHAPAEYAGVNVGEVTGQVRRETRNMMLLSIPLLLVNPWMAIGNVVVSKFIGKFRTDSELKTARADMTAQIDNMCAANAEEIVRYTEAGFDRQLREGEQNIKAAYAGLIGNLENDLYRLKSEQGKKAKEWDVMDQLVSKSIPELISQI